MRIYRFQADKPLAQMDAFRQASAEELRLLLLLAAAPDTSYTADELSGLLSLPLGDTKDALSFWRGAGAVRMMNEKSQGTEAEQGKAVAADSKEAKKEEKTEKAEKETKKPLRAADALPAYSSAALSGIIEKENLASFVETCQEAYGKVFSTTDVGTVIGLREQLMLPCDYICLLIAFCVEHGRKPMRYVEKVAFSLYDQDIVTTEALTDYIEKKHRQDTREGALRKLFGIGERALTAKEEKAFLRWCEKYGYDDGVIGLAYDIAVNATGKASVPYADTVISRWNQAGCKSLADVEALLERERTEKAAQGKGKGKSRTAAEEEKDAMRSFAVEDFFAKALNRSYGTQTDQKKKDQK